HGVGIELHEDPIIYNYGKPGNGMVLKEGMVLAIEPMASLSTSKALQLKDDSFVTSDNSLSAHFESTVLVVKNGSEVLTK
ncbi:MAG: M24 family metallopeptidase, partial [Candidatus Colwellbacteria bacterium]|nr:M24 family metallopeptidase [Candidatus Colwellbacteria bacterium]